VTRTNQIRLFIYTGVSVMHITIVSGSHRVNSQSEKIARFIESNVNAEQSGSTAYLYSLANNPLPLWDQSVWGASEEWAARLDPLKEQLQKSDAFVIITPEWHGQVPAGLKNFFLLMSRKELGHKPALIIAVSSGAGGAYPIAELRMSSYKNNRICYIPEQLIIRDVEKVFNAKDDDNDQKSDKYYKKRLAWSLSILQEYGVAMKSMRNNIDVNHDDFSNGM